MPQSADRHEGALEPTTNTPRAPSSPLDARIEPALQQIHEEVNGDEEQRDDGDRPLENRQVALEDGLVEKKSGAGPSEDRFDEDRAAEHLPELQPRDGEDRRRGVAEDVKHDASFRQAAGAQRLDELVA